jgi:hypothetical protein
MRKLTIKEVIRALPFDENTKKDLLGNYDSYTDAMKFEIMHTCWNAFDDMLDAIKEDKEEQFSAEVAAGTRSFGENFMKDVEDAAWEDVEAYISGKKVETEEIENVRKQLQNLIVNTSQSSN